MLKFVTLFSGSSGNCALVYSDETSLLIDMGVSCRRIVTGLKSIGKKPEEISGVLVTHEHSDHIGGCEIFLKKYDIPLYCTSATKNYLIQKGKVSFAQRFVEVSEESVQIGDIWVTPFATSHDSLTCRGYRIECGDASLAIATDIGYVPEEVYRCLRGCSFVALESNYDEYMLRHGPYPPELRARIASKRGHLSNDECAGTIARLVQDGTSRFMLVHISEENNTPDTALTRCFSELENRGLEDRNCTIVAAPRYEMSDIWEIG